MKVAVIGVGRMGRRHILAARNLGCEIVGVSDMCEDSLELAKREAGLTSDALFQSAGELLKTTRPECVVIATTADSHADLTCLAVASGARFILCEKPMATSLADCDRMIEACRRKGVRLAVNHQMRFMEQYVEVKRIASSEAFGGLRCATIVAGNFGMAMNGTHYFEMFRYLTDEPAAEVTAWFDDDIVSNPRGPRFEDRAGSVRITTASGKRFYLDAGADQGHGLRALYAGRNGQIFVDELAGRAELVVRRAEHRDLPTTRYGMPFEESSITIRPADAVEPTSAVLSALRVGKDYPSGEDGRLAVATLVAAYLSNEDDHRAVRVDGDLPRDRAFPWA